MWNVVGHIAPLFVLENSIGVLVCYIVYYGRETYFDDDTNFCTTALNNRCCQQPGCSLGQLAHFLTVPHFKCALEDT